MVNKKIVNRSNLRYHRGDPNHKAKLPNGKKNPKYRGSGFYYNRTWTTKKGQKINGRKFPSEYMSKYSNGRDYNNPRRKNSVSVRKHLTGGVREKSHQTDNWKKAGDKLTKNLNTLNSPANKTNLYGNKNTKREGKTFKSAYKGTDLDSKFRKQEKKFKKQQSKYSRKKKKY